MRARTVRTSDDEIIFNSETFPAGGQNRAHTQYARSPSFLNRTLSHTVLYVTAPAPLTVKRTWISTVFIDPSKYREQEGECEKACTSPSLHGQSRGIGFFFLQGPPLDVERRAVKVGVTGVWSSWSCMILPSAGFCEIPVPVFFLRGSCGVDHV